MKNRKFSKSARGMKMTPFLINLQKEKANKKTTIFYDNKPFSDVLVEGVIFATGTATALTILSALIVAFINL